MEVTARDVLLHVDCFEKQRFAFHVDSKNGYFPVAGSNQCLFNVEGSTRVEVAKQTPCEFYFLAQTPTDPLQPQFIAVKPNTAVHGVKHLGFVIRRFEFGIWRKSKAYQITTP